MIRFPKKSEAAKLRWAARYQKGFQKKGKSPLEKDLSLLNRIIAGIRFKLEFPEKNRAQALEHYHENANRINDLRRFPGVMRTALRRQAAREQDLASLEKLMRRADLRMERRAGARQKAIVVRALRRRFNKGMDQRSAPHQKSDYIFRLCGVPLMDVVRHLESLFKPGMTWENYGFEGWHIDHIKPLKQFNILDTEEQKKCFHFSNLQPLWKAENLSKRDK